MQFSALLGNPVAHSVSNELFSQFASATGIEYAHIKVRVPQARDLPRYLDALQQLGCAGANVTLPYKLDIIQHLDDRDAAAVAIGAVNTIAFLPDGKRIGYNTDGAAAYRAIVGTLRPVCDKDRVVVLGAGGAARAIVHEIYQRTERISIYSRGQERLEKLAADFRHSDRHPLKTRLFDPTPLVDDLESADFLINATPVGMYPHTSCSLVSEQAITHLNQIRDVKTLNAFDAIFNPYLTLMLQQLRSLGSPVCSGLRMMTYQAMSAFEIWTGHSLQNADVASVERRLITHLTSRYGATDAAKAPAHLCREA